MRHVQTAAVLLVVLALATPLLAQEEGQPAEPVMEEAGSGDSALDLRVKGDKMMRVGQYKSAHGLFSKAIELEPENHVNFYKRAMVLMFMGASSKALTDLATVVDLDPTFTAAHTHRSSLLLKAGSFDGAEASNKAAIEHGGANDKTAAQAAAVGACRKMSDDATAAVDNAGGVAARVAAAIPLLNAAVDCAPENARLRLLRAEAYRAGGDIESALADTERAIRYDAVSLAPVMMLGQLYYDRGDEDNSMKHLKACLQSDPDNSGCRSVYKVVKAYVKNKGKAETAAGAGKYTEALEKVAKALKAVGDHPIYNFRLLTQQCDYHMKAKQGVEAVAACTKALELEPENLDALLKRGEARIEAEMFEEAVRDYQTARQKEPNNRRVMDGLGKAERALKISQRKDYYKILGLPKDCTTKQVKKAYRKLSVIWHPDKHPEGPERDAASLKFKDIAEAKEVLTDEEKRRRFDNGEDLNAQPRGGAHAPHFFRQGGQTFSFKFG